jgi:hypothetical protein
MQPALSLSSRDETRWLTACVRGSSSCCDRVSHQGHLQGVPSAAGREVLPLQICNLLTSHDGPSLGLRPCSWWRATTSSTRTLWPTSKRPHHLARLTGHKYVRSVWAQSRQTTTRPRPASAASAVKRQRTTSTFSTERVCCTRYRDSNHLLTIQITRIDRHDIHDCLPRLHAPQGYRILGCTLWSHIPVDTPDAALIEVPPPGIRWSPVRGVL